MSTILGKADELLDALEKAYKLGGGRAFRSFRSHLKPIREAFGEMRAVDVTAERVDKYIDRRQESAGDDQPGDAGAGTRIPAWDQTSQDHRGAGDPAPG